ncbi:hypothetical protein E3T26_00035 [Cryobacterium sp. TMT1-21]|uniref:PepSY domain-containing protein n=1 Tax=unclassified Cryobacterium TaxID=2649013 RepID=UPI00106AE205|nr:MULTISPECIES: PepSY domain-containing protein [unclassified Cryobacterium]TFD16107.1 hypothetical protein E3T32_16000 [Cryobacterium sp. TMT2-23]TFD16181.1 hypothetical protein E3T42_09580 [Cryobacterium sp. TMT4-10]TFD18291.1 hypothetical protein E3T26_00035 [Cryobacterium sp. TMT1-21]
MTFSWVPRVGNKTWIAVAVAVMVAVGAGAAGIATAVGSDDTRLTDNELERASRAALTVIGPGTVTDAQRRPAAATPYEVETRLPNGVEVTVELDATFAVVWMSTPGWTGEGASALAPRALTRAELASVDRTSSEQAALAEVGSGTVTDFRQSTALDHAFEVEVTLENGTARVVELTERSQVVHAGRSALR